MDSATEIVIYNNLRAPITGPENLVLRPGGNRLPVSVWEKWVKWPGASARKSLIRHLERGDLSRENYPRQRVTPKKPDVAMIDAHSKASGLSGFDFRTKGVPDKDLLAQARDAHEELVKVEAERAPTEETPLTDEGFVSYITSLPKEQIQLLREALKTDQTFSAADFLDSLDEADKEALREALNPPKRRTRTRRKDIIEEEISEDDAGSIPD